MSCSLAFRQEAHMTIANIVSGVNTKLAGETLTFNQMKLFLSEVIDDINGELNATFPSLMI